MRGSIEVLGRLAHAVALYATAAAAAGLLALTALSAAGVLPWLSLSAGVGGTVHPGAGAIAQVGVTLLVCLLAALFPSGSRVMALERSHRDFRVTMHDVARAYHFAHMGDRAKVFSLSSEFDQVRERLDYLRQHPDLKLLEADVLVLAAQMSQQSRDLAVTYADDKVARARDFLAQRQQEAEDQQRRIDAALAACREIRRWADLVGTEEAAVASRLGQLDEEVRATLVPLGYRLDRDRPEAAPAAPPPAEQARAEVASTIRFAAE